MSSKSLSELAALVNGELVGDGSILISEATDLANAGKGAISFLSDSKKKSLLDSTSAEAIIVRLDFVDDRFAVIRVKDPNLAFAQIHNIFISKPFIATGISPNAVVGENCLIPSDVSIGSMCVLGSDVELGERVVLHPGVVIGDNVKLGDECVVFPNVTIYSSCQLGQRVVIHSGTVIGSDGFGYATTSSGVHVKRPHVGRFIIQDDVEIGANVCVDRGTFGDTVIGSGTKIDNLVQVAHNVEIGENSLLVAQSAIAGSSSLGKNVILGGQTGLAGHIHLGDYTMVGAQSGVHNNQKPGSKVSGTPAISHKKWLRASVSLARLPELINDVKKIKKQLLEICS
jgi:UDP-3-O-[3-hydroxymyristoyl] glucosamine N-acyltransferase